MISFLPIKVLPLRTADGKKLPRAPRVPNDRVKIHWNNQGIEDYKDYLQSSLPKLISLLGNDPSPSVMSVLLRMTYSSLVEASTLCFPSKKLSSPPRKYDQYDSPTVKKHMRMVNGYLRSLRDLQASHTVSD